MMSEAARGSCASSTSSAKTVDKPPCFIKRVAHSFSSLYA
jgi:hypothetical protein